MKKFISLVKEFGPVALSLVAPVAFAQNIPPPMPPSPISLPQGTISSVGGVLQAFCTVFGWAFWFLIALALIFVVVAAFKYLTAGGDPEKVKSAGATLLYAAIAVGVALLARAVPLVIASFLGASNLSTC
jgi:hypothetical protein